MLFNHNILNELPTWQTNQKLIWNIILNKDNFCWWVNFLF
jgi:hypothetical protein